MFAPASRTSEYMKQNLAELKGENSSTIIVGNLNTLLSVMDRMTGRKVIKDVEDLSTVSHLDLPDLHRTLCPQQQNTFFSTAHGAFSWVDYILGYCKTSLSKFKDKLYEVCFLTTVIEVTNLENSQIYGSLIKQYKNIKTILN